ncbi:hypothetical protein [Streptomyces sp. NPDC046985]|uniref:hypothetical protein n=1 Tax=Streptomyces sp. NPDC046985 TaxID=3155377 RepID=UPI0033D15A9E
MTQQETIEWLLKRSQRYSEAVPIRRAFVQDTEAVRGLVTKPGPLRKLMRSPRALDLLLITYAVTAGGDFAITERSETWGRAAGISFDTTGSASAAVSRQWAKLEKAGLIKRSTDGRRTRITKLLEDGLGNPYTLPSGSETGSRKDVYFKLPFAYWYDGLHNRLEMPAKVVMLIGMSQRKARFALPRTQTFADWYGLSAATMRRGIEELSKAELLDQVGSEPYITGETATGWGIRTLYAFRPPYHLNVNKTDRESAAAGLSDSGQPVPATPMPLDFS